MEVPAPKDGVVVSMKINVDDQVNEGDLLMELQVGSSAAPVAEALRLWPKQAKHLFLLHQHQHRLLVVKKTS